MVSILAPSLGFELVAYIVEHACYIPRDHGTDLFTWTNDTGHRSREGLSATGSPTFRVYRDKTQNFR